ncbi:saccharopine dehydrogenase NADP-binding domain-containing protein, partial [Komagataeibacter kakiaceti]|uniref:saccharopine dehydrogenase NADP-binding domain-containing protein n=1 Tax=Komagataeibacter kakiaceti TaxID=943261 RepID=UPI0004702207
MTRRVATVFGGSGFVGQPVVGRLARAGYVVRVAGRGATMAAQLRMLGDVGQVVPVVASVTDEAACVAAIEGSHLVINLVGILSPPWRGHVRGDPCGGGRADRAAVARRR